MAPATIHDSGRLRVTWGLRRLRRYSRLIRVAIRTPPPTGGAHSPDDGQRQGQAIYKESTAEPAPASPPPATAAAAVAAQPQTAAANADIPTVEDFEEEAAEDIKASNMEAELDRLEKEINE